jgi:hypothetical protein
MIYGFDNGGNFDSADAQIEDLGGVHGSSGTDLSQAISREDGYIGKVTN